MLASTALLVFAWAPAVALADTTAAPSAPIQIFFTPDAHDAVVGEITRSDIWIDTGGVAINAADLDLQFGSNITILSAEHSPSIFDLWVHEPDVSTNTGIVRFTGGSTVSFSGRGVIGQIYWQANQPGTLSVTYNNDSAVLFSDGQGTRATVSFRSPTYTLISAAGLPDVTSSSHPDQNAWYQTAVVHLNWPVTAGTAYSYVVTKNPDEEPDETADTPVGSVQLSPLPDGIYYFRIREKPVGGNWSNTATRQFKIDATAPDAFTIHESQDASLFNGKPFISFVATDQTSGVASYEVQEGNDAPVSIVASPYVLKHDAGSVPVRVTAIDRAGNRRDEVLPATRPLKILSAMVAAIVVLVSLMGLWFLKRPRRART